MSGMPQVQELMRSAKDTCTNTFTTRYDVEEALSGDGGLHAQTARLWGSREASVARDPAANSASCLGECAGNRPA